MLTRIALCLQCPTDPLTAALSLRGVTAQCSVQRRTPQGPTESGAAAAPPRQQSRVSQRDDVLATAEHCRAQGNGAYTREEYRRAEQAYTQGLEALAGISGAAEQLGRLLQNRAKALSARVRTLLSR